MTPKPDSDLLDLMESLQLALRQGDFDALPRLTSAIQAAEPQALLASPEDLLRIRILAERNGKSLLAAGRGVKAARRRIAEVISAARGLVTYDRGGRRVQESDARILAQRF